MLTAVRVEEPPTGCSTLRHVAVLKVAVLKTPVLQSSVLKDSESANRHVRETFREPSSGSTQYPKNLVESGRSGRSFFVKSNHPPAERPIHPNKENHVQVVIRSRNIELNDRLKTLAEDKVTRVTKYFPAMEQAEITFFEEKNKRIAKHDVCEVTLHGHGHHIRAKATAVDPFAALDLVVDKLAHQLSKVKDKLVTRHHDRHHHYGKRTEQNKGGVALLEPDLTPPVEDPTPDEARIVKVKQFVVTPLSADEAVLKMDLLQHDFFVFTNIDTGRAAVVYRRDDGHLGLIDAMS